MSLALPAVVHSADRPVWDRNKLLVANHHHRQGSRMDGAPVPDSLRRGRGEKPQCRIHRENKGIRDPFKVKSKSLIKDNQNP